MNTQVNATGMNIKAAAEGGIIISNEAKTAWSANATASHQQVVELVPTSTANMTTWYHAMSDEYDNAKANQGSDKYINCGTTSGVATNTTTGVGVWTRTAAVGTEGEEGYVPAETANIYLLNKFYIKSSAEQMDSTLLINKVTVTGNTTSPDLDKALRVAIVIGNQTYIFAAFDGATLIYKVGGANDNTTPNAYNTKNVATTTTSIPANNTLSPIEASVYLYFEGEDANCKSSNITTTLDQLSVSVQFGTSAIE